MSVILNKRGNRVTAVTNPSWIPGYNVRFKEIAGRSWSNTRKEWSWPLTMSNLRLLRAEFGDEISIGEDLLVWARRERRLERRLRSLGRTHDSGLVRTSALAPALAEAMASRTYQRSGARFAAQAGSFCLADEPGLGKTATILAGLMEANLWRGKHLIVAPKSALDSTWKRQIEMWTGANAVAMPEGVPKRRAALEEFEALEGPAFLIVNPAMLRRKYGQWCRGCERFEGKDGWPMKHHMQDHRTARKVEREDWPQLFAHPWESIILDESHMLLASNTPSGVRSNMQLQGLLDLAKMTEHRFALTGTPMRGQEQRLWGTMDWLSAHKMGGYWSFVDSYFDVAETHFGKEIVGVAEGMRAELEKQLDRWFLRRTKIEVRPDLPLGQRVYVMLDMLPKQRKAYEAFAAMGETDLAEGSVGALGVLSERTRLKQLAYGAWQNDGSGRLVATQDSPKLEWIVQFLEDRGVTGTKTRDWLPEPGLGYKYVIASQNVQVLDSIRRDLERRKIVVGHIDGRVSQRYRTSLIKQFQSDDKKMRVMLIQTQTGGVSIELDAWADEMVIVDETDVADEQVQLEGRIDNRSGRVAPRMWHYLVTKDTIEMEITDRNYGQHVRQHKILDERRGVTEARHKTGRIS